MGQSESSFTRTYQETVSQLSNVQLGEITTRFNELYASAGGTKGLVVDREAFSKYLNVPVTIGDRLFDAFDTKKNGSICFEEFVCGLALVLHGSFKERCGLLFSVFNLGNDEGITRAELRTMLTAILQSTNTILYTVGDKDSAVLGSMDMNETIVAMVDAAFENCDISKSGKLLPMEFEYWLKRNPKILDTMLSFKTKKEECTLGPLIMSPSEQRLSGITPLPQQQSPTTSSSNSPPQQKKRSPFSLRRKTSKEKSPISSRKSSDTSQKLFEIGSSSENSLGPDSRLGSLTTDVLQSLAMNTKESLTQVSGQDIDPGQGGGGGGGGGVPGQDIHVGQADQRQDVKSVSGVNMVDQDPGEDGLVMKVDDIDGQGEADEATPQVSLQLDLDSEGVHVQERESQGEEGGGVLDAVTIEGLDEDTNVAIVRPDGTVVGGNTNVSIQEPDGTVVGRLDEDTNLRIEGFDEAMTESAGEERVDLLQREEEEEKGEQGVSNQQVGVKLEEQVEQVIETGQTGMTGSPVVAPASEGVGSEEGVGMNHMPENVGSIMHADSALSIDMTKVPRVQSHDQLGPASPVLPTQTLEEVPMGGSIASFRIEEEKEEEEEVEQEREEETTKEVKEMSLAVGVALTETRNLTKDKDTGQLASPSTPSQMAPPLFLPEPPKVPSRGVSPFLEESEGSEVDEDIYQAWVLNPWTQGLLENPQLGAHLTCPALMTDIQPADGISDLLATNYPDRPRKTLLSVEHVSMDAHGLRRLISSGSLHAALELTGRFLSAHGQGLGQAGQPTIHTHKTLQMWCARIALMVHLKLYKEAELELHAFGEILNPDLYYQYHTHSYPGKKGSLVPFTLRLLHANLPRYTGKFQLALDRLCSLQCVCEQIVNEVRRGRLPGLEEPLSKSNLEVAENIWRERLSRVKCSLANTLIAMQEYGMAAKLYEQLAEECPEAKAELYSVIGRLYLQLGDLQTAKFYFDKVLQDLGSETLITKLNEGYMNVFLSRWQTASDCFEGALALDPSDMVIQSNIAVCTFYMGRLKESIISMEKMLISNPPSSLQPSLFANLATAYELESGSSSLKKLAFIPLLAEHIGQGYPHLNQLNIR